MCFNLLCVEEEKAHVNSYRALEFFVGLGIAVW